MIQKKKQQQATYPYWPNINRSRHRHPSPLPWGENINCSTSSSRACLFGQTHWHSATCRSSHRWRFRARFFSSDTPGPTDTPALGPSSSYEGSLTCRLPARSNNTRRRRPNIGHAQGSKVTVMRSPWTRIRIRKVGSGYDSEIRTYRYRIRHQQAIAKI